MRKNWTKSLWWFSRKTFSPIYFLLNNDSNSWEIVDLRINNNLTIGEYRHIFAGWCPDGDWTSGAVVLLLVPHHSSGCPWPWHRPLGHHQGAGCEHLCTCVHTQTLGDITQHILHYMSTFYTISNHFDPFYRLQLNPSVSVTVPWLFLARRSLHLCNGWVADTCLTQGREGDGVRNWKSTPKKSTYVQHVYTSQM